MTLRPMRESFYAIRRTDGEQIWGDYAWMGCDGPDDWTVADNADDEEPVEYEIVRMHVEPIARKTYGDPHDLHERVGEECQYCGEPWPCDYIRSAEGAASPDPDASARWVPSRADTTSLRGDADGSGDTGP